jgi:fermentation-respiration switch protein FrsA (DUF1100 family)
MKWGFGDIITLTLGATAAAAGAAVFAGARHIVNQLTKPQPIDPAAEFTFTPWELNVPWEDVRLPARSGAHEVRGWWLPQPTADRVIIACAGYRGSRADLLGISTQLWRAGNSVLLMDFYGHGVERGVPVTLGYREVDDFLGAVDYAAQRAPTAAIGAIGFSMGAAVAIQGAAREPRVRAVVADSAFATHRDVVAAQFRQAVPLLSPEPFLALADPLLHRRAGYRFAEVEPLREVAAIAPRPILIIHSTGDKVIPYQHAIWLYEAAGEPKELWIVEDVAHCGAYFIDRPAYCQRVADFFARGLAASPHAATVAPPAHRNDATPDTTKQPAPVDVAAQPPAAPAPQPKREVRGIERAMD